MKNFGLIPFAEEISKQSNIISVMWILVVTLMKIYNEKEQAEQGKLQNVKFEEERSTRKWNTAKSCIQGDKQIKKWNKESGDLRAGSHPAKFPNCEKELKKSLDSDVVGHTFNPSTGKADAGRPLGFRPV